MRDYGQIQCSLWTHPRFKKMDEFSQLLLLYLLTGRHSNGLGCYSLPLGYVCADLKKGFDTVSKGFAELSQNRWAYHCESTEFVLLPKFLKWNPIANPKVGIARQKEFDDIPSSFTYRPELARALLKYGGHFKPDFETLLHTVSQTVSETVSKQEPNRTEPNREEPSTPEVSDEPPGPPPKFPKITDEHMQLAEAMAQPVRKKFPTQQISIEQWADDIRKILELDKRDQTELITLWKFIEDHKGKNGFCWGDNCRSPAKLRDRDKDGLPYYDLINNQRLRSTGSGSEEFDNWLPPGHPDRKDDHDTIDGEYHEVGHHGLPN